MAGIIFTQTIMFDFLEKTEGHTPVASPTAAHLAHAVLPQNIKARGFVTSAGQVTLPVTMSQFTRLVSGITTTPSTVATTSPVLLTTRVNDLLQTTAAPSQMMPTHATITEVSSCSSGGEDDAQQQTEAKDEEQESVHDSFSSRSPILVDPEKLEAFASLPASQQDWVSVIFYLDRINVERSGDEKSLFQTLQNFVIQASDHRAARMEPKGRRSTSLPGPPVTTISQPGRDDRSMSLPHSLTQVQQRANGGRALSVTTRPQELERLQQDKKEEPTKKVAEVPRKLSSPPTSTPAAAITTTAAAAILIGTGMAPPAPVAGGNSKRGEVYV